MPKNTFSNIKRQHISTWIEGMRDERSVNLLFLGRMNKKKSAFTYHYTWCPINFRLDVQRDVYVCISALVFMLENK